MKIKKIKFSNYRCFNDAEFLFDSEGLNVVIGKNGSGKTELLFAIEWALYDLDFSLLKGKENTPYALNSDIYRKYNDPNYDEVNEASVIIEFSHPLTSKDGTEVETDFWLKKYARYRPSGGRGKPKEEVHSQLSIIDENGTKSTPAEDDKFNERIKKIIPKKILGGILFDGERMKALSNDDEDSRDAIDGFISEITNIEQLTFTRNLLEGIRKDYTRDKSKLISSSGDSEIAVMNDEILKRESVIEKNNVELKDREISLATSENSLKQVKAQLETYKEIQNEINERNKAEAIKEAEIKGSTKRLDTLEDILAEGYILQCNDLFDIVSELVHDSDVPTGLTIEAANSILARPKCICGEPWTEKHRKAIMDLIQELPPENLNSSVIQTIEYLQNIGSRTNNLLTNSYKDITESNRNIEVQDKIIAAASKAIGSTNVEAIKEKETQRERLSEEVIKTKYRIDDLKTKNEELIYLNKKDRQEIENYEKNNKHLSVVSRKESFSRKCVAIVDEFIDSSKKESLDAINVLISKAFSKISEDYDRGKRIYITQFVEPKYRIVTYYQSEYDRLYNQAIWTKLFADYNLDNTLIDNEEIRHELIVLQASDSLSTGQRKIVTLSFVKAVTDFAMSKDVQDDAASRVKRNYPLFIDAPFSELSGENLSKFAAELPHFNEQSIVMMDPDIFEGIKSYFKKDIKKHYNLEPSIDKNDTIVTEVK